MSMQEKQEVKSVVSKQVNDEMSEGVKSDQEQVQLTWWQRTVNKVKDEIIWAKENPREATTRAVQYVTTVLSVLIAIYQTKEVLDINAQAEDLRSENIRLKKENMEVQEVLDKTCSALGEEIARSKQKDDYFSKFISDDLRNGSSLAGQEMNARKQYLKELHGDDDN